MRFLFVLLALTAVTRLSATREIDVEYGRADGETLRLDLFVPEGDGPFPAVILVHGGGWNSGDKSGGPKKGYMAPLHAPLEQAGYAWFSINYRLAPKYPYPANIEDVETAIRWVKAHAAQYQVDPARIALSGESAGGHLVELAAVRADKTTRVAAVIPFYAPGDLTKGLQPGAEIRSNLAQLFGRKTFDETAQKVMREASPVFHLKRDLPPFLLVHGTGDRSVAYEQSLQWQTAARDLGLTCDLITIKEGVHGMLSWDSVDSSYKQGVVAWLNRTLKPAKPTAQ